MFLSAAFLASIAGTVAGVEVPEVMGVDVSEVGVLAPEVVADGALGFRVQSSFCAMLGRSLGVGPQN